MIHHLTNSILIIQKLWYLYGKDGKGSGGFGGNIVSGLTIISKLVGQMGKVNQGPGSLSATDSHVDP
jgi:hypothetical protein